MAEPFSATAPLKSVKGTVSKPGVTFTEDVDTGLYSPGANQVAVTTGGVQRLLIGSDGSITPSGSLLFPLGSADSPSISFTGDPNTGIYSPGADQVSITTSGTQKFTIDSFDGNPVIENSFPDSRPTLDLAFALTKTLDPRITFSRASSGTYMDGSGVIQSAAAAVARFDHDPVTGESLGLLVEEARTNSLLYSSQLTNSYWNGNSGITTNPNSTVAPDGTITALSITQDTSTGEHRFGNSLNISPTANATLSIFVKPNGCRYVGLSQNTESYVTSRFDLTGEGSVLSGSGTIQSFPDGWYRISEFRSAYPYRPYFHLLDNSGSSTKSFTGDGVSGVWIWGFQKEAGSFPTSYIPTPATFTSRASTATYYDANGVIQTAAIDVARDNAYFPDENGVFRPAGLLLEGSGTNLFTYSEDVSQWNVTLVSRTNNVAIAPDGTSTADLATTTNNGTRWIGKAGITLPAAGTYTFSVFAKAASTQWIQLRASGFDVANSFAYFDLASGVVGSTVTGGSAIAQKLSNGWVRCSFTFSSTTDLTGDVRVTFATGDGVLNIPTGSTLYLWGAQLEAGASPTSYIPTTSSTVTRAADVSTSATVTRAADVASITGTNFSSWYRQDEGTILVSQRNYPANLTGAVLEIGGTTGNYALAHTAHIIGFANAATLDIRSYLSGGGSPSGFFYGNRTSPGTIAYAYKQSNYGLSTGGNSVPINAGPWDQLVPVVNSYLGLGRRRDGSSTTQLHVSRLTYWPTRLSDATLQALTR